MAYTDNMITVVYTVDRSENYLASTINSLKNAGIKCIIVSQGSKSDKNLKNANVDGNNFIVDYPKEVIDNPEFDSKSVRYKAQVNFINALRTNRMKSNYRLVLEDDVHASKQNTTPILNAYLRKMELLENGKPYILSLYTPYFPKTKELDVKKINLDHFYGTQACLYTESISSELADFIEQRIASLPHDYLIKDFCRYRGIAIYGATYSLFQHTGVHTTGLGHHHTAENFVGD